MNSLTTQAFSLICRNEDVFQFTQEYGIHGVTLFNLENHDENWFNPRLLHSLGYNKAPTSWKKIISPANLDKMEKILDASNFLGDVLSGEINFLHSRGFLVPMTYKALHINENMVIAVKKVSDYSHIEYNADTDFQKEQLLETVLETIDVGIIACDNKGKLTLFNKASKKWHGLPAADIPQTEYASYYNLYHPDGKTLFKTEELGLIDMLHNGIIRKPEMIIKPKTGRERFIVVSGSRLYDAEENICGAVIALHNITDIKEAENQLTVSEEMFRGTFENAFNGMAISDLKGQFIKLNDSLCKMVGYSQEELMHLNFLDITHPDDVHEDLKVMQEMLNSERDYLHNEKRFINKNGKHIHVILSVSMVRDHNSNPIYFIAQMIDITELKSAQKELGKVLSVTIDQNSRLNNFAHIVSHNLRSHSGNLEMLLEIYTSEHPDVKQNEIIQMALKASGKLKETIQDLNEMAFIDLAVSRNVIPINLRNSVTHTLGAINALIQKANLQIYNDIPANLEVLALPAYMESIILNFSTNAIKYRSSERTPILRFEAIKKEEYIEMTIQDNGMGIDLEKYGENLFGMYKTFHHNVDAKGIGLFISKNQIEAIGGKIEVQSEVNIGTIFTLYFKYEKN